MNEFKIVVELLLYLFKVIVNKREQILIKNEQRNSTGKKKSLGKMERKIVLQDYFFCKTWISIGKIERKHFAI